MERKGTAQGFRTPPYPHLAQQPLAGNSLHWISVLPSTKQRMSSEFGDLYELGPLIVS